MLFLWNVQIKHKVQENYYIGIFPSKKKLIWDYDSIINLFFFLKIRKQAPTFDTPPKYKTKVTIVEDPSPDEMFLRQGYRWSEGKRSQYGGLNLFWIWNWN